MCLSHSLTSSFDDRLAVWTLAVAVGGRHGEVVLFATLQPVHLTRQVHSRFARHRQPICAHSFACVGHSVGAVAPAQRGRVVLTVDRDVELGGRAGRCTAENKRTKFEG